MSNATKTSMCGLLILLGGACAKISPPPPVYAEVPRDYKITVNSDDNAKRFEITLLSKSKYDICISVDDWPNNLGELAGGPGRAVLELDDRSLTPNDTNFGLCIGKRCTVRIKSHDKIRGFINYKEFGYSADVASSSKKSLAYFVKPYKCD